MNEVLVAFGLGGMLGVILAWIAMKLTESRKL